MLNQIERHRDVNSLRLKNQNVYQNLASIS
jgi:hypothetical protein